MFWIILILILIFVLYLLWHLRPIFNDSILLITGGPGKGKSSTGCFEVIKAVKIKRFKRILKKVIFPFRPMGEKPYIYSNIPLSNVEYKEFTLEHLTRKKRMDYNSVIFLNECSLIADSMLAMNIGRDEARKRVNKEIQLFCKLIRHELKGKGLCMVLDTQNPNDLCMAGDRVLNEMVFLTGCIKLPFFRIVKWRKIMINVEGFTQTDNKSIDRNNESWSIVPKSVFKKYNSYCYEFLSHDKPVDTKVNYIKIGKFDKDKRSKFNNIRFKIPTLTDYAEIKEFNEYIDKNNINDIEELKNEGVDW